MSSYIQKLEKQVRELEIKANENAALRKENKILIETIKDLQSRQPNYSHNEAIDIAVKHGFITKFEK